MLSKYDMGEGHNSSLVESLHNPEQRHNDVYSTISLIPEFTQFLHRQFNVALYASTYDALHYDWMRLIAYFEDIIARDEAKTREGRL